MKFVEIDSSCFGNEKDARFFNTVASMLAKAQATAEMSAGKLFKIAFESLLFNPNNHAAMQYCLIEYSKYPAFFNQFKKWLALRLPGVRMEVGKLDLRIVDLSYAQKAFIEQRSEKLFNHDFFKNILNFRVVAEKAGPKELTEKVVLKQVQAWLGERYDKSKMDREILLLLKQLELKARAIVE